MQQDARDNEVHHAYRKNPSDGGGGVRADPAPQEAGQPTVEPPNSTTDQQQATKQHDGDDRRNHDQRDVVLVDFHEATNLGLPVLAEGEPDQEEGHGEDSEDPPGAAVWRAGGPVRTGSPDPSGEHPEPVADRGVDASNDPLQQPAPGQQGRRVRQRRQDDRAPTARQRQSPPSHEAPDEAGLLRPSTRAVRCLIGGPADLARRRGNRVNRTRHGDLPESGQR